jgi:hypothetical protein
VTDAGIIIVESKRVNKKDFPRPLRTAKLYPTSVEENSPPIREIPVIKNEFAIKRGKSSNLQALIKFSIVNGYGSNLSGCE